MVAQSAESVEGYKLTNINLEYETIEGVKIVKETKQHEIGRSLWFNSTTLLKTVEWSKNSTRQVIDINVQRRSMKAIVFLFKKKSATQSEEYVNAEIDKVKVTIEGNPNSVYSQGHVRSDIYDESRHFFGTTKDACSLSKLDFLKNKYALVVDMRTVYQEDIVNSGRRLKPEVPKWSSLRN